MTLQAARPVTGHANGDSDMSLPSDRPDHPDRPEHSFTTIAWRTTPPDRRSEHTPRQLRADRGHPFETKGAAEICRIIRILRNRLILQALGGDTRQNSPPIQDPEPLFASTAGPSLGETLLG